MLALRGRDAARLLLGLRGDVPDLRWSTLTMTDGGADAATNVVPIMARLALVDANGFIRRGNHRVLLRVLSERKSRSISECPEDIRQHYIDMAMLDVPLIESDGDEMFITDAGRHALSRYHDDDTRHACGEARDAASKEG